MVVGIKINCLGVDVRWYFGYVDGGFCSGNFDVVGVG